MTTLPNLNLTLPTRGAPGSGLWGDTEDNNLTLLDAHDHSSGKGVRIKTAGIAIDADLSFSSLYAPTALNRITFSSIAALSSNNKSLFVSNADNELYWRSNAGANVKLTSGSSLNVAAFTGGIGGDYTAVGAAVAFDDANDRYTFKQQGGVWARMASGEVRILETGTSETVYVGQAAPAALAASYTMTWPTANPGATSVAQIDSTGQWSFTNTIVNDVTLAANKSVIVSGSGLYKHGVVTVAVPVVNAGTSPFTFTTGIANANPSASLNTSAGGGLLFPIAGIPTGKRIVNIRAKLVDEAAVTFSLRLAVKTMSALTAPAWANQGGATTSAGTATIQLLTVSAINYTIAAFTEIAVELVTAAGGTSASKVYEIEVDYDQP